MAFLYSTTAVFSTGDNEKQSSHGRRKMGSHGRENWSGFFWTVVSGQAACHGGSRGGWHLLLPSQPRHRPRCVRGKSHIEGEALSTGCAVLPGTGAAKPVPNDLISFLLLEIYLSVTGYLPLRASS